MVHSLSPSPAAPPSTSIGLEIPPLFLHSRPGILLYSGLWAMRKSRQYASVSSPYRAESAIQFTDSLSPFFESDGLSSLSLIRLPGLAMRKSRQYASELPPR